LIRRLVSCFLRVPPGVLQGAYWRTEAGDASRPHAVMTNGLISCESNVVALSPSRTSLASLDWLPCPGRPSQFTFSRLATNRECTRVYSGAAPANLKPPAQHAFVGGLAEANRISVRLYLDLKDVHAEVLFHENPDSAMPKLRTIGTGASLSGSSAAVNRHGSARTGSRFQVKRDIHCHSLSRCPLHVDVS
jgi:hypothetical protein